MLELEDGYDLIKLEGEHFHLYVNTSSDLSKKSHTGTNEEEAILHEESARAGLSNRGSRGLSRVGRRRAGSLDGVASRSGSSVEARGVVVVAAGRVDNGGGQVLEGVRVNDARCRGDGGLSVARASADGGVALGDGDGLGQSRGRGSSLVGGDGVVFLGRGDRGHSEDEALELHFD